MPMSSSATGPVHTHIVEAMALAPAVPQPVAVDNLVSSSIWHALAGVKAQLLVALVLLVVLSLVAALVRRRPQKRSRPKAGQSLRTVQFHLRTQLRARYALRKLAELDPLKQPSLAFQYLRSVCPFTFEEMVLLQLSIRKLAIERNRRYIGDGGVDGRFVLNGQCWLVQAKKYSGMVRPADIMDFAVVCEGQGAFGLFVHTGRTPPAAHAIARESHFVEVLSGDRLLSFFAGEKLRLRPQAADARAASAA